MKRFISVFLVFLLAFTGFTAGANAASYKDTPKSYRFYDEINYLSDEGIIYGYPDGSFGPEKGVSRASAVMMIGRALGLDGTRRKTDFPDVDPESAASGYIQSAYEAGIISGYPTGRFEPDNGLTRAAVAIFLSRAFEFEDTSDQTFSDMKPHMASYPHVKKLIAANVIAGYADGRYGPEDVVTRGQFSAFMARTLDDNLKPKLSE